MTDETPTFGSLQAQGPETDSAETILERASKEDYDHCFAAVSGGHDSLTAMHVAYESDQIELEGIIHINTGIGIPETREFVEDRAEALGLDFHEVDEREEWREYENRVQEYGLPGTGVHEKEWINNKHEPLNNFLSQFDGTPLIISGARRHESDNRWENVDATGIEYDDKNDRIWASPLAGWTGLDVRKYRRERDLPMNPVVDLLELSGECLCGAYGDREELRMIREFYPWVWAYIQSIEAKVIDAARNDDLKKDKYKEYVLWGHGKMDDEKLDQRVNDGQMMMCQACEQQDGDACLLPEQDDFITLTEAALQVPEDERPDSPTLFRDSFDLTQSIPEDEDDPILTLRRGYNALDDFAQELGYENHREMVADRAPEPDESEMEAEVAAE